MPELHHSPWNIRNDCHGHDSEYCLCDLRSLGSDHPNDIHIESKNISTRFIIVHNTTVILPQFIIASFRKPSWKKFGIEAGKH
jgi:hypothetical protein